MLRITSSGVLWNGSGKMFFVLLIRSGAGQDKMSGFQLGINFGQILSIQTNRESNTMMKTTNVQVGDLVSDIVMQKIWSQTMYGVHRNTDEIVYANVWSNLPVRVYARTGLLTILVDE